MSYSINDKVKVLSNSCVSKYGINYNNSKYFPFTNTSGSHPMFFRKPITILGKNVINRRYYYEVNNGDGYYGSPSNFVYKYICYIGLGAFNPGVNINIPVNKPISGRYSSSLYYSYDYKSLLGENLCPVDSDLGLDTYTYKYFGELPYFNVEETRVYIYDESGMVVDFDNLYRLPMQGAPFSFHNKYAVYNNKLYRTPYWDAYAVLSKLPGASSNNFLSCRPWFVSYLSFNSKIWKNGVSSDRLNVDTDNPSEYIKYEKDYDIIDNVAVIFTGVSRVA